ncbi:hypothetical protein [Cellulosimicrobium cellulans]|nr:hypothetical protein [Cellulosimicrobium cellulans]
MTARRLATIAFRGQFWAAAILPICLVAGSILAGGGLLMAAFTLAAVPLAAFLALGPSLGAWVGKMRGVDDVPLPYALVTVALWVAVLPVGFLTTYGQEFPSYAEAPPGNGLAEELGGVAVTSALLLWPVQLVLALVGVRMRRRPQSGLDRSATAHGAGASG